MSYWVKTPRWLKCFFPADMVWEMPAPSGTDIYLTFDDGPHPTITPFVLAQLREHNAKATFFCVGNNVARFPAVYQQILNDGHHAGNHTYNHLNGWRTDGRHYVRNIEQAAAHIDAFRFRPPYGRIKMSQFRKLKKKDNRWKIYMWDILSGDFDKELSPEQCLENVMQHIEPGTIIVFHDSEKAWDRLSYVLPIVLSHCSKRGWQLKALP